jgi:ubiquinone/menaquinone biosynthesis C-methylase UbiE
MVVRSRTRPPKLIPAVGASGTVIGADIAPAMLVGARDRLRDPLFRPVAADGQALPFMSSVFDAVLCQLGLQFFPDPARGLAEFYRVLALAGIELPKKFAVALATPREGRSPADDPPASPIRRRTAPLLGP